MKNITVVNLSIPNGSSSTHTDVELTVPGSVVAAALHRNGTPTSPVDVKIETTRGDEIYPSVDHQEFLPTGGAFKESRKPIDLGSNRQFRVKCFSSTNLTADFDIQLVFYHQ